MKLFASFLLIPLLAAAFVVSHSTQAAVLFDAPGHAAVEGTAVTANGGEPGVAWALQDWRGRETGVAGVFDADGNATLPPLPAGYYRMVGKSQISNLKSQNFDCLATLAVLAPPHLVTRHSSLVTNESASAGSFLGVDCAIDELHREFDCPWNGGDAIRTVADLAALAGFAHVRGRHSWARMQRSPDLPPDCAPLVANAALFRDRGIDVSGLFYGTPGWANEGRARTLPGDLGVLYRSCRDIAVAFGDTVYDWEFFNETDIGFLNEPVWDYASALKAAYLGFKAGNPKAPVLCAGLCTSPDGFYLKTLLENGAAPYFDVFNYHTYAAPTSYHAFVGKMREALERAGVGDKPIWITESGTNFEGPARNESVRKGFMAHSPEQELVVAEFAPKSVIAMQMEGIERDFFFILAAYSERNGGKDWGLLRRDGTVKPAYAALATMARELRGARLIGTLDTPAGIRAYLYEHADGLQTVVFWAESKIDTATNGNEVVKTVTAEAREWALPGFAGAAPAAPLRLVDLCGSPGELAPTNADGSLTLSATRYPAYVTGLRWLKAANGAILGGARGEDSPRPLQAATSPIIPRVILAPGDFGISNNKTLAVAKGDEPHLCVQFWNLSDAAVTGTVEAVGAVLEGLPTGIVAIAPFGCAEFDCALKREGVELAPTLTLSGIFNGQPTSRLSMPLFFENLFMASCEAVPLDWRDPAKWTRNDSADTYAIAWDEAEQAIRFEVEWKTPGVGRWFYPVLQLPPGTLDGAMRASFEVKAAQDKVENDFGEANLMLVRGEKGGSPADWLRYQPPIGTWERRYVELSSCPDLGEVDAIRLGANPQGMRLTFWVRDISALRTRQ